MPIEYNVWIPVAAVRFNDDGSVSLKKESATTTISLENPWHVMVKDGSRWTDSGEGPWDKKQDAIDFARAEVGLPYKVVKRVSNPRHFVTDDGYRLHKEGDVWTDGDLVADDVDGHPVDMWGNRLEGYFTK